MIKYCSLCGTPLHSSGCCLQCGAYFGAELAEEERRTQEEIPVQEEKTVQGEKPVQERKPVQESLFKGKSLFKKKTVQEEIPS